MQNCCVANPITTTYIGLRNSGIFRYVYVIQYIRVQVNILYIHIVYAIVIMFSILNECDAKYTMCVQISGKYIYSNKI